MSIKMGLIAVAAMALTLIGLASPAMAATDGVLRDMDNTLIPNNKELHLIGWMAFLDAGGGGIECHTTAILKATGAAGTGGDMTNLSIPSPTKFCTGKESLAGCKILSATATKTPYTLTATPTDLDVTGTIIIDFTLSEFLCPTSVTVTATSITLKPLNTTNKHVETGTTGNLGNTAAAGEQIAGFEISGMGTAHMPGTVGITVSGALEISETSTRCTYKLVSS